MEFINNLINNTKIATQAKINTLQYDQMRMLDHLDKLKTIYPSLVETLAKQKLEIVKMYPIKTGSGSNWESNDYMKVGLTLKPTTDTFKFIKFDGYTSSGAGRNRARLNKRANKLRDAINEGTGLDSVSVNEFSFEYGGRLNSNENIKNKTILVDFWINA